MGVSGFGYLDRKYYMAKRPEHRGPPQLVSYTTFEHKLIHLLAAFMGIVEAHIYTTIHN